MTFDLRGMGLSRATGPGRSLRELDADLLSWARLDFAAAVPHAPAVVHVLSPADVGMQAIGHVGAFRRSAEPALWPRVESALA